MWPTEQVPVYYNASPVQTYNQKMSLILAQSPMKDTTEDFWRLIADNNVRIIIMLNPLDPLNPDLDFNYWPSSPDQPLVYDKKLEVHEDKIKVDEDHQNIIIRYLKVHLSPYDLLNKDHPPHSVIHIQYLGWKDEDQIDSLKGFKDLLHLRQLILKELEDPEINQQKSRVLIHCR